MPSPQVQQLSDLPLITKRDQASKGPHYVLTTQVPKSSYCESNSHHTPTQATDLGLFSSPQHVFRSMSCAFSGAPTAGVTEIHG